MAARTRVITARWLSLAAGWAVCAGAGAQSTNWAAAQNGNWGAPGNWTSGVPTATTTANILVTNGTPYTVTLDASFTAGALNLGPVGGSTEPTLQLNDRSLTIRGGYVQTQATLLGVTRSASVLTVGGAATFSSTTLEHTRIVTRGSLLLTGSAAANDICDTDMDHRGSVAQWTGLNDLTLDNGGRLAMASNTVFTVSNDRAMTSNAGGQLVNAGRLVKSTGSGTTFIDGVSLTNTGAIEVQTGTFRANALSSSTFSGGTLSTGSWSVLNGRRLELVDAGGVDLAITTTNASVLLSGAGASFAAINGLTTIGATGKLAIQNGVNFTTVGSFTNNGVLSVGSGLTFRVAAGSGLTNLSLGTLGGTGTYNLQGRLKIDGAVVTTLGSKLTLDGGASGLVDQNDVDALTNLANSAAGSALTVTGGRAYTSNAPLYTIAPGAKFTVGASSRITLNALDTTTFNANRLSGAVLDVSGVFQFDSADVRELATGLTLNGPSARVLDENNVDGLMNFAKINSTGTLTVSGGKSLSVTQAFAMDPGATLRITDSTSQVTLPTFINFDPNGGGAGSGTINGGVNITVGKGAILKFNQASFRKVPTGLTVLPGGKVQNQAGLDAFTALNQISTNATFGVASGETRTLQGGLTVDAGGTLLIGEQGGLQGAILNVNGALNQNGNTNLGNGQLNVAGNYNLGGKLTGDGAITAPATIVTGTIAAGHSPALLTITSDVSVGSGATFEFEIGAPEGTGTPGTLSDFVQINGTLTFASGLAGIINYNFISAFDPEIGDQFVLARATAGISGLPAGAVPLGTDILATVSVVGGTDLVLTVTQLPTPGAAGLLALLGLGAARRRR